MKTKTWIATAAALLVSGCSSNTTASSANHVQTPSDLGQCSDANSCKGRGSCATSKNSCAGQNNCKGKGWLPLSKADCKKHGGRFKSFTKNS